MNSVWMLEAGQYSDYHVVGLFSTEEKAKFYMEHYIDYSTYDSQSVCEVKLDPELNDAGEGHIWWSVSINISTGNISFVREETRYTPLEVPSYIHPFQTELMYLVSARDKQHACKVAAEKRTAYLLKKELLNE